MKKILLLSDTHGYIDDRILHYASQADEIWHAGDWGNHSVHLQLCSLEKQIYGVYGNIDGTDIRTLYPKCLSFETEGVSVWMTHIGGYPPSYTSCIRDELSSNKPNVFICGHSHILKVMYDSERNILHINPGACGIHGFHKVRTLISFSIRNRKPVDLEVIELSPRYPKQ